MSLANVRAHWRFLLTVLLILVAAAAAGPLLFYGIGPMFAALIDRFGAEGLVLAVMIIAVVTVGWLFFVLWAGDKADRLTAGSAPHEAEEGRHNG